MNRQQRRAARKVPTGHSLIYGRRISELPDEQRRVLCALIKHWLTHTEPGREIRRRGELSLEEATDCICELCDNGLMRLRFGPGTPLKDAPFYIEPVLPMGGWEGGTA